MYESDSGIDDVRGEREERLADTVLKTEYKEEEIRAEREELTVMDRQLQDPVE